jgi:hypothetical protein
MLTTTTIIELFFLRTNVQIPFFLTVGIADAFPTSAPELQTLPQRRHQGSIADRNDEPQPSL